MIRKLPWLVCFGAAFAILTLQGWGLDTYRIDKTRKNTTLQEADFAVIDDFVAESIKEILAAEEISDIIELRQMLFERRNPLEQAVQARYEAQFVASIKKNLPEGLAQADKITPRSKAKKIVANLLILLDSLAKEELGEVALPLLDDDNAMVRYWAAHAVMNKTIISQLNALGPASSKLFREVVSSMTKRIGTESSPAVMGLFVDFCINVKTSETRRLLVEIGNARINEYKAWNVQDELLDGAILAGLAEVIGETQGEQKQAAARCFGQLYASVVQKYLMGAQFIGTDSKRQLVSTMVEIEQIVLPKLLGVQQATIKNAIEKENLAVLRAEYESLFGTADKTGRLGEALGFNYGPQGNAPAALPEPPKPQKDK
ncbi:MAG: hypothetical protein ABIG61_03485 [Planctomycetota bacterium]